MDSCAADGAKLATTKLECRSFHLLRRLGDDVDHAVKGVEPIHGGGWAF